MEKIERGVSSPKTTTDPKIDIFQGIDEDSFKRGVNIFHPGGKEFEVRLCYVDGKIPNIRTKRFFGADQALEWIRVNSGRPGHVYHSINSIRPGTPENENIDGKARIHTIKDQDVDMFEWIIIDIDAVPGVPLTTGEKISSTDQEKALTLEKAYKIEEVLLLSGFESPIYQDSGNGTYLAYKVEFENTEETKRAVSSFYKILDSMFSDQGTKIDQVGNPSHVFKMAGTMAVKGKNTPERPHRKSKFLSKPEELEEIKSTSFETLLEFIQENGGPVEEPIPGEGKRVLSILEEKELFESLEKYVSLVEALEIDVLPSRKEYIEKGVLPIASLGPEAESFLHRVCKFYYKGYDEDQVAKDFRWALKNGEKVNVETFFYWCEEKGIHPYKNETDAFPYDVFPIQVQEYGENLRKELNFNPSFVYSAILATISGAMGNSYAVERTKGHVENGSLYLCIVGDRGTCKSHPVSLVLEPLSRYEDELFRIYKSEMELYKFIRASTKGKSKDKEEPKTPPPSKPTRKRVLVGDSTTEALAIMLSENPRGGLQYSDEIGGALKEYKNGRGADDEFRLSVWSGKSIDVTRVTRDSLRVSRPFLSLIGTSQPSIFADLTQDKELNGFLDRLLVVWVQDAKVESYSVEEAGVDERLLKTWSDIIGRILRVPFLEEPRIVPLSPGAKKLFVDWHNKEAEECNHRLSEKIRKTDGETYTGIMAKMFSYALRFSLLLEVVFEAVKEDETHSRLNSLSEVSARSMEGAIRLCRFFTRQAMEVRRMTHSSNLEKLTDDKKALFLDLPDKFTTAEGLQVAKAHNIPERTFKEFLRRTIYFSHPSTGVYEKVFKD